MHSSVNKRRDMARSILPSKSRPPGKLIKKAKRANRHAIKNELTQLTKDVSRHGDEWDNIVDLHAYPDAEINALVSWRRGGDKINHFERWAIAITKELPQQDRLSYMRAILPDGLIGDHAMSHLRDRAELHPNPDCGQLAWEQRGRRKLERIQAEHERRHRFVAAIRAAMDDGHHGALNDALKKREPEEPETALIPNRANVAEFVDMLVGPDNREGFRLAQITRVIDCLTERGYVRPTDDLDFQRYFAGENFW